MQSNGAASLRFDNFSKIVKSKNRFKRPLNMAHRGGGGLWPENTLPAFESAARLGVDVLEMDIQLTADGVPVVIHDETIDAVTNGSGAVNAFDFSQLQQFDAGYRFTSDQGKTYPYRNQGLRIPSLAQVFSALPHVRMNIDLKSPDTIEPFSRLMEMHQMESLVTVASFDYQTIARFRQRCPRVHTSASKREILIFFILQRLGLEKLFRSPAKAFQIPEYEKRLKVLTQRFAAAVHRLKSELHVWTVNDEPSLLRMIAMGVDGIITDYPDRLAALYRRLEL